MQRIMNQSSTSYSGTVDAGEQGSASSSSSSSRAGKPQKEVVYSVASEQLIEARKLVAVSSVQHAQKRLAVARKISENVDLLQIEKERIIDFYYHSKEIALNSSQFGDDRPLTAVSYCASGALISSGSLGPAVKIWDTENFSNLGVLRCHSDRITSTAWHPEAGMNTGKPSLLCSTSGDGSCILWDCQSLSPSSASGENDDNNGEAGAIDVSVPGVASEGPVAIPAVRSFIGHKGVVSCADFHPMGNHIGTAGHDCTWRLWDVENGCELLQQDGHTKECSTVAFHPDGSLALSGDAGGVCLLWDLRSGQMIMPMQGHVKKISQASFNPNGFHVATSSVDNTVRIWDIRKKRCGYTLPGHPNIISGVKYSKSGEGLLTCSFDGTLKIWNARNYTILRTLVGHTGKVMACDFAPDEKHIVSAGYDRTLKLWAHKDEF